MDNAQTDNLVEALARAMRRERNALSDAVDYEISDGAIDLFACACLPVIQSLSAHPAGDVALREAVAWRYQFKDNPPVLVETKKDWADNHPDWTETPLYLATPAVPTTDASGEECGLCERPMHDGVCGLCGGSNPAPERQPDAAAPTILISQEWLDAKNATDPDAECDAAAPTERDPIGVQEGICTVPPEGWWCSRTPGHEGPCAARPIEESDAPLTDDENAMIDRAWERHKAAAPTDPHVHRMARRMDAKWVEREAAPTDAGALVERVKDELRGQPGDDYTDAGMEDAFFRWPVIERAILAALRASTGTPAEGEGK